MAFIGHATKFLQAFQSVISFSLSDLPHPWASSPWDLTLVMVLAPRRGSKAPLRAKECPLCFCIRENCSFTSLMDQVLALIPEWWAIFCKLSRVSGNLQRQNPQERFLRCHLIFPQGPSPNNRLDFGWQFKCLWALGS